MPLKVCLCPLAYRLPLSVLTAIFQVSLGQPVFIEAKDDVEVVVTTGLLEL